jgi:hypothetical protein
MHALLGSHPVVAVWLIGVVTRSGVRYQPRMLVVRIDRGGNGVRGGNEEATGSSPNGMNLSHHLSAFALLKA